MPIEELRVARCDDCGAVENIPPPTFTEDSVSMLMVPQDWGARQEGDGGFKTYCPACKFLHGFGGQP
jgi:hypothetical protein